MLIEYVKLDVPDVQKALKSARQTSDGTTIDKGYFRNLIEQCRDLQINTFIRDRDKGEWVQTIRKKYVRDNYDITTRNYIFYEILKEIGNQVGGWGIPTSSGNINHPEAEFIYQRIYDPLKSSYKIAVFLVWLWRDHTDVAIKFYEDLQLYDLVEKHKQRIARENQEPAPQPTSVEKSPQNTVVFEQAQIDARGVHQITIINVDNPVQMLVSPQKITLSFGRDNVGGFKDRGLYLSDLEIKKTSLYELFENRKFVADNGMIETYQVKPHRSFYRNYSWMVINNALLDSSKIRLIDDPCAFVDAIQGFDLLSVGGSRSCPSVRISLGGEADGSISQEYGSLYYTFDLSSTETGVQDNFGEGLTQDPRTFIRGQKGELLRPSTIQVREDVHLVTQDWALLTIVANPFDHSKRHVLVSACHGIGCVALSELINEPQFQKESKYIDFLDSSAHALDYYQALVRINVIWDKTRYKVDNLSSANYYQIFDVKSNLKLNAIRSVPDAIALYQDIVKARIESEAAESMKE